MSSSISLIKALIGKYLTQSFYRKLGKKLNVSIHNHNDSINMEWAMIGNGRKPQVLFLHGFSDRKENFYFAAKSLAVNYDILIPDMPGFGNSCADTDLIYNLDNYVKWLGEFIEKRNPAGFHLVGSSLGGAVAAKLAVKYPDTIKSLSLVSPAGFYIPEKQSVYDDALNGVNLFQVRTPEEYDDFRGRIFYNNPKLPEFVKEFMIHSAIKNQAWYGKIFDELADLDGVRQGVETIEGKSLNRICNDIKMPTKIFWGKHDTLFPYQTAQFLNENIKDTEICIFENAGHCLHLETPKAFSEKLDEFIKKQYT